MNGLPQLDNILEQNIIIITHGKINGRATVNLKINVLDSCTNHSLG